jgi:hypothetical protein
MAIEKDVDSYFTGMIFLLRKVVEVLPDGRLRLVPGPDVAYARRRPRRA